MEAQKGGGTSIRDQNNKKRATIAMSRQGDIGQLAYKACARGPREGIKDIQKCRLDNHSGHVENQEGS